MASRRELLRAPTRRPGAPAYSAAANIAAATVIALGVVILIAWVAGPRALRSFVPGAPPATPVSAMSMILAGTAILLLRRHAPAARAAARGLAVVLVALHGSTVVEYVSGLSLGVDVLSWGRIALHDALGFLLAGLAIGSLGLSWRKRHPAQLLGTACALVGAFDLLAYAYSEQSAAVPRLETHVSLPIALGQLVLGVAIVVTNQDHSLVRLLRDRGIAGWAARRILPIVLIMAPLAGAVEVVLERDAVVDDLVVTMGMVGGVGVLIFAVAWWALLPSRAAEVALRGSEARFQWFFDNTPDYVYIVSADGRLLDVNPTAAAILGYGRYDLLGRHIDVIMAPECRDRIADLFGHSTSPGQLKNEEMTIITRFGDRRVVLSSTALLAEDGARSLYSLLVQRDVTELRIAEQELDLQVRIRSILADSLLHIPVDATLEDAAQVICDELVGLPFVDMAAIDAFVGPVDVVVVGHSSPRGHPVVLGDRLPPARAARVRARAAGGPWAEYVVANPTDQGWLAKSFATGLKAVAFGPIVHGDHIGGAVVLGTYDLQFARTLVQNPAAFVSFSTTSSALLADRLHEMRRRADLRAEITAIMARGGFTPVFQPIVDLSSRSVVGYEALTRFDSLRRPDLCFDDAWLIGLGPDLEFATLEAATQEAGRLPAGRWLDLNVSPRMLADPIRLGTLLRSFEQPVVLEVTEHQSITDYAQIRNAIRALEMPVRLAVDDAGVGVANFGHIIDLHPDFVKLDGSIVGRVDVDLGCQALVAGVVHFCRTSGCRMIAEGVETESVARMLVDLGVELGQGYLFGRPGPVEDWTEQPAAPHGPDATQVVGAAATEAAGFPSVYTERTLDPAR